MTVQFRYSDYADLVFHVLSHMKVDNASDLYSPTYIEKAARARGSALFVPCEMTDYYNRCFDRLGIINFLPFYGETPEDIRRIILSHPAFTPADLDCCVRPFLSLCEQEAPFYYAFREKQRRAFDRSRFESTLTDRLAFYQDVLDYYEKSALVFPSFSLTRNGRGFGGLGLSFAACIPVSASPEGLADSFFTLLHEYTHQITDKLLQTDIYMHDGSHDAAEAVVILFDYYWIRHVHEADVPDYFEWLSRQMGIPDGQLNESVLFSAFQLPDALNTRMMHLLQCLFEKKPDAKT